MAHSAAQVATRPNKEGASGTAGRADTKDAVPHFVISSPDSEETSWSFPDSDMFTIGRSPTCALLLSDPDRRVSHLHAAVVRLKTPSRQYFVRDLGSLASTLVEGEAVHQRVLREGDEIAIGDWRLRFHGDNRVGAATQRLRHVKSKGDEIGGETIQKSVARQTHQSDVAGHEILEQLERIGTQRAGTPSLSETIRRSCLHIRAVRGFIARFSSEDSAAFEELADYGFASRQQVQYTDERLLERLWRGETVHDGSTIYIPFGVGSRALGFMCFDWPDVPSFPPQSPFISFLTDLGGLLAKLALLSSRSESACDEVLAWPNVIIGVSADVVQLRADISRAADGRGNIRNVLFWGETGTGKQLAAEALHLLACGSGAKFVERECRAIPDTLAETIFFGNERGVFTSAEARAGLFELAKGGSLFLDDIQAMPESVRPALYKVLDKREVARVGSTNSPTPVNVLAIGAVETPPDVAIDKVLARAFLERFRTRIALPPLRQRRDDIPLLAFSFLDGCAARENKRARSISRRALQQLIEYDWPGNIRELRNCIENAVMQDVEVILTSDLPLWITAHRATQERADDAASVKVEEPQLESLEIIEKKAILRTLTATGCNKAETARILDIAEMTLRNKMKRYGIPIGYGRGADRGAGNAPSTIGQKE